MTPLSYATTREHLLEVRTIVREQLRPAALPTFDRAVAVMMLCHLDQKPRPGPVPYVEHPAEVALNVARWVRPLDLDLLIAALLHDSVEDQRDTLCRLGGLEDVSRVAAVESLSAMFGPRVARLVDLVTNEDLPGGTPREVCRKAYIAHASELADAYPLAFTVKLADLWTNALRLDDLEPGPMRSWLASKYGPVMERAQRWLRESPTAWLDGVRDELVGELNGRR